ncbi:MAG TPA: hypothetical protein VGH08_03560 [Chthoniobacterales bacterium]
MTRIVVLALLNTAVCILPLIAADSVLPRTDEIYRGWLKMYDLEFEDAHRVFRQWMQEHSTDPLGPVSDAAAYLFSELTRLGALESELFVDDAQFAARKKLQADAQVRLQFNQQIDKADRLADSALQNSPNDGTALFVKALVCGLRADYAALVEKRNLAALSYTKRGRPYVDRLLAVDPNAFDAYLGLGVENYLLSLKPTPMRVLLRLTGSRIDREKGLEELRMTALHGYYLEPFAKLLLAVAALRDKNLDQAGELLRGLHDRFPDNQLYLHELERIKPGTPTNR